MKRIFLVALCFLAGNLYANGLQSHYKIGEKITISGITVCDSLSAIEEYSLAALLHDKDNSKQIMHEHCATLVRNPVNFSVNSVRAIGPLRFLEIQHHDLTVGEMASASCSETDKHLCYVEQGNKGLPIEHQTFWVSNVFLQTNDDLKAMPH